MTAIADPKRHETLYAVLMALFITFVVLTNTVGNKLFEVGGYVLPVSILWFPLTFLITDITSEVFGEKRASLMVLCGFGMSMVLLGCIMVGIELPPAAVYPVNEEYRIIYSPAWRLLFASMCAYLLAQMADVRLFHMFRRLTGSRHLWLRNNGSTLISQLIDTVTVSTLFLYGNDAVFTGGIGDLASIIVSTYTIKLLIALCDTPFCYLGVWAARRYLGIEEEPQPQPSLVVS